MKKTSKHICLKFTIFVKGVTILTQNCAFNTSTTMNLHFSKKNHSFGRFSVEITPSQQKKSGRRSCCSVPLQFLKRVTLTANSEGWDSGVAAETRNGAPVQFMAVEPHLPLRRPLRDAPYSRKMWQMMALGSNLILQGPKWASRKNIGSGGVKYSSFGR